MGEGGGGCGADAPHATVLVDEDVRVICQTFVARERTADLRISYCNLVYQSCQRDLQAQKRRVCVRVCVSVCVFMCVRVPVDRYAHARKRAGAGADARTHKQMPNAHTLSHEETARDSEGPVAEGFLVYMVLYVYLLY